jgi:SAM-dependent methyltransferase
MDLYSEGLYYARKRVKVGLVQADLHQPPFHKKFDLIGIFDVLEHIADDVQVLRDLYSLIKPGGALLLTVPAFQSLWSYFDVAALHIRRYRQNELNSKLQMAGFKIENTSYYMTSIFPLVWGGRKVASIISSSKNESKKSDQELTVNELRIVPVINQILTWILLNEVKLIHQGVRMPFGTSLMALARKSE